MTAPWMEHALWMKARLFINRAMDDADRTFDEQALWASLALELLAKAALARVSPLLIATPNEEGSNLLIAAGLVQGEPAFQSVPAKTIFTRCARSFRPFDLKEAMTIASGRNEYLHGGAAEITMLPAEVWWPRYWAQASTLLTAQDKDIEDFVGPDRSSIVAEHLEQNALHVQARATSLIERARQRVVLHRAGTMTARQEKEWSLTTDPSGGLRYQSEATCPACGSTGTLEGDDAISQEWRHEQLGEEEFETYIDLTIGSDYFSCAACRLVLDTYELVSAADLDDTFVVDGDPADYADPGDYGND